MKTRGRPLRGHLRQRRARCVCWQATCLAASAARAFGGCGFCRT